MTGLHHTPKEFKKQVLTFHLILQHNDLLVSVAFDPDDLLTENTPVTCGYSLHICYQTH